MSRRPANTRRRTRATAKPSPQTDRFIPDGGVTIAAGTLISLGVVMSYSATAPLDLDHAVPPLFRRHVGSVLGGVVAGVAAMTVPLSAWRRVALPLWGCGILLLVVTAIFGVEANGAKRWLDVGVQFQPHPAPGNPDRKRQQAVGQRHRQQPGPRPQRPSEPAEDGNQPARAIALDRVSGLVHDQPLADPPPAARVRLHGPHRGREVLQEHRRRRAAK